MVLNESGVCSLCGSEEMVEVQFPDPQGSEGSVDLPFGLGGDSNMQQPDLPFGIEHLPSQGAEIRITIIPNLKLRKPTLSKILNKLE